MSWLAHIVNVSSELSVDKDGIAAAAWVSIAYRHRAMIDIDALITELSSREAGEDLEYDAEFLELFRHATEKEDTQYGDHIYTPEPVEWKVVASLCLKLLERTQDLRVAVCLARAWTERHGLQGLVNGLQVVSFLLHERWETVHPQLASHDQFDPVMRINVLAELAVPGAVPARLGREQLACTNGGEAFSAADLALVATGDESEQRSECQLRLRSLVEPQCSPDLRRSLGLLDQVSALLIGIGQSLDGHTGLYGASPLQGLSQQVSAWLALLKPMVRDIPAPGATTLEEEAAGEQQGGASPVWVSGECHSREHVLKALEAVERYYLHYEPSSPVPVLLNRVQRLATMDFIQIIAELTPSSIEEVRQLAGLKND
ncbi:hypothetical protein D3C77_192310 [compost metagenome]